MLDPKFENVAAAASPIRCIHRSCADLSADHDWHFHPEFELTWFLTSSGVRYVGDSVERYGPGDMVLSGPNLPHCWRNDVPCPPETEPEWIVVQFAISAFGESLLDTPEATAVREMLEEARSGLAFGAQAGALAGQLLLQALAQDGLVRTLRLLEALHALAATDRHQLAQAGYHSKNVVDQMLVERLDRIMRYAADHFRGSPSQAELASRLDMTPTALSKFVRSATGATFTGMIKRMRINEACRMLAHGDERITDISLDCGYAHTSHFDHHFQELKGMSPGEYRRRMRKLSGQAAEKVDNKTGKLVVAPTALDL